MLLRGMELRAFCRGSLCAPDRGQVNKRELLQLMMWTCCGQANRVFGEGEADVSRGAADSLCAPLEQTGLEVHELEHWADLVLRGEISSSIAASAVARMCWSTIAELRSLALTVGTRETSSVLMLVEETRLVSEKEVHFVFSQTNSDSSSN